MVALISISPYLLNLILNNFQQFRILNWELFETLDIQKHEGGYWIFIFIQTGKTLYNRARKSRDYLA